ncbi:hypothetical protein JIR001_16740 [Polycladomyces abyssicola]|uniref:Uncharacterized protein n=1 Tax=Polycladomyces abyssicola TaxID=1125966 RepID=A0A8D5UG81_9BACL|nr:cyclase family protein [Polycladomyces abyssicola]BCU81891.1 hypothetical protein JIR001_16740 [Polycladomyces abyssicola]
MEKLRTQKIADHIDQAWEIINLYMYHLKKTETLQKATPHSAAVVIRTMWDKIHKKRKLDLKEQENEIRRRELERKERGLSDEAVEKVVDQFVRALGVDPSDVWEGIENERPPEETAEETK